MTSAGVMMAKVIWNMANSDSGIVPTSDSRLMPLNQAFWKLPMTAWKLPPSPNASP
jgi:hypothetical protein